MSEHPTEASFLKDVSKHTMEVLMDQDVYRHIRFSQAGSSNMYFDLITVPGKLVYTGDMGTFVFSRSPDMFKFFRKDRRGDDKLYINNGYWAEKLIATSSCGPRSIGAEEFDEKHFDAVLYEKLVYWIKENRNETDKDERRELWDTVVSDVFNADADSGGFRKQIAAHDFHHHVNDDVGSFSFVDLFDHRFTMPTYHFVWACYAIAWGVQRWDEAIAAKEDESKQSLSADGWIAFASSADSECPVGDEEVVMVRLKSGSEGCCAACYYSWDLDSDSVDSIVAYKVVNN